jgi:hypothetical protein
VIYVDETPSCGVMFLSNLDNTSTVGAIKDAITTAEETGAGMVIGVVDVRAERRLATRLKSLKFKRLGYEKFSNPSTGSTLALYGKKINGVVGIL